MTKEKLIPVMVTTEKQGVFFGYISEEEKGNRDKILIHKCRMAVRYFNCKGVLGLTVDGPNKECRITKAAPTFTAHVISGCADVTPKAVKAWEKGYWKE